MEYFWRGESSGGSGATWRTDIFLSNAIMPLCRPCADSGVFRHSDLSLIINHTLLFRSAARSAYEPICQRGPLADWRRSEGLVGGSWCAIRTPSPASRSHRSGASVAEGSGPLEPRSSASSRGLKAPNDHSSKSASPQVCHPGRRV